MFLGKDGRKDKLVWENNEKIPYPKYIQRWRSQPATGLFHRYIPGKQVTQVRTQRLFLVMIGKPIINE